MFLNRSETLILIAHLTERMTEKKKIRNFAIAENSGSSSTVLTSSRTVCLEVK